MRLDNHDDQIRLNLPWFMTTSNTYREEDTFFCLFLWQGSRDWVLVSEEVCSLVQYDTSPPTSWSMSLLVFMLTLWLLIEVIADQYFFSLKGFSLQSMPWILIQFLLCDLFRCWSSCGHYYESSYQISDIQFDCWPAGLQESHMQTIFGNRYLQVTWKLQEGETNVTDTHICESAWQNINCPQLCVPVPRCLCWWWGQVATWAPGERDTMSHYQRENISSSKISKQFTKPPAFTPVTGNHVCSPQSHLTKCPGSCSQPAVGAGCRGNLSIFRVVSLRALRRWRSHRQHSSHYMPWFTRACPTRLTSRMALLFQTSDWLAKARGSSLSHILSAPVTLLVHKTRSQCGMSVSSL